MRTVRTTFSCVRFQTWTVVSGRFSTDGGITPIWASDGTALFYSNRQTVLRVGVDTGTSFSASVPESLFEGPYALNARSYDVAPDGTRLLMLKLDTHANPEAHLVLNWFESF